MKVMEANITTKELVMNSLVNRCHVPVADLDIVNSGEKIRLVIIYYHNYCAP